MDRKKSLELECVSNVGRILNAWHGVDGTEAKFAVVEAQSKLSIHDMCGALKLLDYAQRLAPSATAITFAIGLLRTALGDPRATEPLELVATRTEWRDAIMQLAFARAAFGNVDSAAAELHRTLRMNAPGRDPNFRTFATTLADETGAAGWCGLDSAGRLTLGGNGAATGKDLIVELDGEPIQLRVDTRNRDRTTGMNMPKFWQNAENLSVTLHGRALIGSPIDVRRVIRFEGFVAVVPGGIEGWCWLPGDRDVAPVVEIRSIDDRRRRLRRIARNPYRGGGTFPDFAAPRAFSLSLDELTQFRGALRVEGIHGRALYGSPVNPHQLLASAQRATRGVALLFPADKPAGDIPDKLTREPSIPVTLAVPRRQAAARPTLPRPVDIVIPVYCGINVTLNCLDSVLAGRSLPDERIIVVVDASPEKYLIRRLEERAKRGQIILQVETENRGFPATANIGIRMSKDRDVILLNSDTLVPPGWAALLQAAAYTADDVGTATPLSNDATIFSYPLADTMNPALTPSEIHTLSGDAAKVNGGVVVDVPTGHGFCMYIRRKCLDETGVLREDIFGHGYGEENDFSMRARIFGWRHVAVPGLYVGHIGSQSFAATKTHLIRRNNDILNRLHVGYDRMIQDWLARDPLAEHRRRLDNARFQAARGKRQTVALITHDRSGGVSRHVYERALQHESQGRCVIILKPLRRKDDPRGCRVETVNGTEYPNLIFRMSDESNYFLEFLQSSAIEMVELHHFIGHASMITDLVSGLGVPVDVYVHDYSWFCPRITLTTGAGRYCGEPDVTSCAICITDHGQNIDEEITPQDLRARSTAVFLAARTVIAPSNDAARRMKRQLRINSVIGIWEAEKPLEFRLQKTGTQTRRRICVVGAIGPEKGYDVLLQIARLIAARRLPLEIVLVGFSCDDRRLLQTGSVTITGRYEEHEAHAMIEAQQADFGFLPAQWPETWSYTLSQMWEARLPVIAFDIGAPAERVRARKGGMLVPLQITTAKLIEVFLHKDLFSVPDIGHVSSEVYA